MTETIELALEIETDETHIGFLDDIGDSNAVTEDPLVIIEQKLSQTLASDVESMIYQIRQAAQNAEEAADAADAVEEAAS